MQQFSSEPASSGLVLVAATARCHHTWSRLLFIKLLWKSGDGVLARFCDLRLSCRLQPIAQVLRHLLLLQRAFNDQQRIEPVCTVFSGWETTKQLGSLRRTTMLVAWKKWAICNRRLHISALRKARIFIIIAWRWAPVCFKAAAVEEIMRENLQDQLQQLHYWFALDCTYTGVNRKTCHGDQSVD